MKHYIACQGPLPTTATDFWRLVWERRVQAIAMVTMATENGKVKCHRYWPESVQDPFIISDRCVVSVMVHFNGMFGSHIFDSQM